MQLAASQSAEQMTVAIPDPPLMRRSDGGTWQHRRGSACDAVTVNLKKDVTRDCPRFVGPCTYRFVEVRTPRRLYARENGKRAVICTDTRECIETQVTVCRHSLTCSMTVKSTNLHAPMSEEWSDQ
jgi:hypothetical protein